MFNRGKVLVAILNNKNDFKIAYEQNWYRIPVISAKKLLKKSWPPQLLAFYQTKVFGKQAYAVNYFTKIIDIKNVNRQQLFPTESYNKKSNKLYYKLIFNPLQPLAKPILSRRFRRIVFIPTTEEKFFNAIEINDLYNESPLEDRLWAEFKNSNIQAERQELIKVDGNNYMLDFSVYCVKGNIDIETDGETYHNTNAIQVTQDKIRNNALTSIGWSVLRFNTMQINEQMADYCLPRIEETINNLGGLDEGRVIPRTIDLNSSTKKCRQLGLFDDL